MASQKRNALRKEGAQIGQAGGPVSITHRNAGSKRTTSADILASTETTIDVQLAKVLALLLIGPKTTMELRRHGIMMPAARVFQLKRERGYLIRTERLSLYDAEGIRHSKCARYHLIAEAASEVQP